MASASWNGVTLAESEQYELVEGNVYFPRDAVREEYLRASGTHTECGWKGTASYLSVVVDGAENTDAAWYYPHPKEAASNIAGFVAFWKGVEVKR